MVSNAAWYVLVLATAPPLEPRCTRSLRPFRSRLQSVICRSDKPFKGRDKNAAENIADVTEAVLDGAEHPRHLTREYHVQLRRGGLDA